MKIHIVPDIEGQIRPTISSENSSENSLCVLASPILPVGQRVPLSHPLCPNIVSDFVYDIAYDI